MNHLVDEIFSLFKEQLAWKNITFNKQIKNENIIFDPGQLKQIFINLISNSIEAIGENGAITIESENMNQTTQVKVSDTGNGIPAEKLNDVFNPFFTNKKNGTGLGLAICKKLCLQNNAQIEVNNNPNIGCQFIISKRSKYDA